MMLHLKPGDPAPYFNLPSTEGREIALKEFKNKNNVVLYFYPKDDTPGCTKEACAFRDIFSEIKKVNAVVLGVSLDSIESHLKFIKKYALPFTLLSDQDASVSKAYGVYKLKTMYGREFWGIERSTFLIDTQGGIIQSFSRVKVDFHIDEVLLVLKKAQSPHR